MDEVTNFNEIFRKDVTYDNIKSQNKPELYSFSKKHIFGKNKEVGGQIDLPVVLGLK